MAIRNANRNQKASNPKKSSNPPQTPAITRLVCERRNAVPLTLIMTSISLESWQLKKHSLKVPSLVCPYQLQQHKQTENK
jgi:hypothetical protein